VKTKNLLVAALAVLLVGMLWYRVVYSSMGSQAAKANQAADEAETRAKTLDAQLRALTGDAGKRAPNRASLDELKAAVPDSPALAQFLRQTDAIRAASGVTFQSITPTAPAAAGGLATINVNISVQGTYAQVRDYVSRMLSLPRLVVVDNLSYTAAAATSSSGAAGAPTGGPAGDVFAGQGTAPNIQAQFVARLFTTDVPAPAAGTAGRTASPTR
jgi:Tfp pilus assembly protein PilO